MAALGNATYPSPAYDTAPGTAGTLTAQPWASFLLGTGVAPPGDDGSGIPGTDSTGPTVPTTGQIWPRGNP